MLFAVASGVFSAENDFLFEVKKDQDPTDRENEKETRRKMIAIGLEPILLELP